MLDFIFLILLCLYVGVIQVHSQTAVCCPIVKCNQEWDVGDVADAADLCENEYGNLVRVLENRKAIRSGKCKQCPKCGEIAQKPEKLLKFRVHCTSPQCRLGATDFCWLCGNKWKSFGFTVCGNKSCISATVNDELKRSGTTDKITRRSDVKCPKIRACPHCLTLVQYKSDCKHMKCWSCGGYFCFICLQVPKSVHTVKCRITGVSREIAVNWGCKGGDSYRGECEVAKVQELH